MVVSKEQAFAVAIDGLDKVWFAISKSSDAWARSPKMTLSVATASAQGALSRTIKDIGSIAESLPKTEPVRELLENVVVNLEEFKAELQGAAILNARELVHSWSASLKRIMNSFVESFPEVAGTAGFGALMDKVRKAA